MGQTVRMALAGAATIVLSASAAAHDMEKARALYDKGLADMLAGNYATGCPALAESYLLSKRSGPLFTTAECEAKAGKLAAALRRYRAWIEL